MDNLVKKQKNRIVLALVAKLMGLAIVLNIASCSCKKDDGEGKKGIKLSITGNDTSGKERKMTFEIKNDGKEELDPDKVELKFLAEITMKAKDTLPDPSEGEFEIGNHKGKVGSGIDKPFKEVVANKIAAGKNTNIDVQLKSIDASKDQEASVTVTIKDKDGKEVAKHTIKLTEITT